jgi:enoyl-CoA hydratase
VRADEAERIGLVDRVVPAAELLDAATDWAAELARGPVVAMGLAKRAIDRGLDGSLAEGLDIEADAFVEVFATEDAAIGVRSFLADGPGKAQFAGR